MNTILFSMYRYNPLKLTFNYVSSLSCLGFFRHQKHVFWLPKWPTGESELWTNLFINDIRIIRTLSRNQFLAQAEKGTNFSLMITNSFQEVRFSRPL